MSKLYQYKLIYTKQENLSSWVTDVGNSGNPLTLKTFRKYWSVPADLLQMKYAVLLKTVICCFFFSFFSPHYSPFPPAPEKGGERSYWIMLAALLVHTDQFLWKIKYLTHTRHISARSSNPDSHNKLNSSLNPQNCHICEAVYPPFVHASCTSGYFILSKWSEGVSKNDNYTTNNYIKNLLLFFHTILTSSKYYPAVFILLSLVVEPELGLNGLQNLANT